MPIAATRSCSTLRSGTLYATIDARGSQNGVWKSVDGGGTWTHLTSGFPSPAAIGRTSLAIAPSQPTTVYAICADTNDKVLGVFRSDNGGAAWRDIAGNALAQEGQMSYGNTIAVHPADPNQVLCGEIDLHLTRDGGATWTQVTKWDANRGDLNYAHADHHCLLMPTGRPGLVYDINDGGMDVSVDGGQYMGQSQHRACHNNALRYSMLALTDGRMFGGGAQDNGTNITVVRQAR